MRESIGALSIFSIVMTFIVLFTAYLAVSINYAKAFRIKNTLITAIENNEGIDYDSNNEIRDRLDAILTSEGYSTLGTCDEIDGWKAEEPLLIGEQSGKAKACVYKRTTSVTNNGLCSKSYYKVKVFFKMDLPILGDLLTFGIYGDTRGVYNRAAENCVKEN